MATVVAIALAVFFINNGNEPELTKRYGFEVIRKIPHDPTAFTQGFLFHDGRFYESTGQRGTSTIRRINPEDGHVEQLVNLAPEYFGEGLAFSQGVLIQLTWTSNKALVYNHETLEKLRELHYEGQGWGLTHDGTNYVMSDGSARLSFRDQYFNTLRTVEVKEGKRLIRDLNELEFIEGEIWANVWRTWDIVRISPSTGKVLGRVNLRGILKPGDKHGKEDYLNGIAYDKATKSLWVTGKNYSNIYQIRIKPKKVKAKKKK